MNRIWVPGVLRVDPLGEGRGPGVLRLGERAGDLPGEPPDVALLEVRLAEGFPSVTEDLPRLRRAAARLPAQVVAGAEGRTTRLVSTSGASHGSRFGSRSTARSPTRSRGPSSPWRRRRSRARRRWRP